ncbi:MAG: hypothetical protein ACRETN_05785 [Nevskiales bacterium]
MEKAEEAAQRLRLGMPQENDAQRVLHAFCESVWYERTPSNSILKWVADLIEAILENSSHPARKSFGLSTRGRGAPADNDGRLENILIYLSIAKYRGLTRSNALDAASDAFHRHRRAIEKRIQGTSWKSLALAPDLEDVATELLKQAGITPPRSKKDARKSGNNRR